MGKYDVSAEGTRRDVQTSLDSVEKFMKSGGVFLGGSCNPTVWRKEQVIPFLDESKISYYNPQVENWSNPVVPIEAQAKQLADVLLFVLDTQTLAMASMVEVAEHIASGSKVVLVSYRVDLKVCYDVEGCDDEVTQQHVESVNLARGILEDQCKKVDTCELRLGSGSTKVSEVLANARFIRDLEQTKKFTWQHKKNVHCLTAKNLLNEEGKTVPIFDDCEPLKENDEIRVFPFGDKFEVRREGCNRVVMSKDAFKNTKVNCLQEA